MDMRAILVGPTRDRRRLRSQLEITSFDIVGEFRTLAEARGSGIEADAIMVATDGRVEDDGGGEGFAEEEDAGILEPLTPREIQVLELLAQGLPNKAIAGQLRISDQTVKFHVSSISGKLGAANRTDAVH